MRVKFSPPAIQSSRGAVFVEAAVGFFLLLGIVFAIIEYSRYASMQAVLQASVDEALTIAQTIDGLDSTDSARRKDYAEAAIRHAALRLPAGSYFGSVPNAETRLVILDNTENSPVRLQYSQPPANIDSEEQRRKLLEENPIRIELQATVPSLFGSFIPSASYTLRAVATGFREPRNPFSEPVPLDCKGNQLAPGAPQPADCACPYDPTNSDLAYNPALAKCTCTKPATVYVEARGVTSGTEWGLTYNPETNSCDCPSPYVMKNGNCVCGLTDQMCESAYHSWDSNKTPFGAGAHVVTWDFYFPVCHCVPPCGKGSPTNVWGISDTAWDPYDQRCECAAPPGDVNAACSSANRATYPGDTYSGNWAVTESCSCRKCGLGSQLDFGIVSTQRYTFGCDCSTAPPCPSGAKRANYQTCECLCDNGVGLVMLPDGTITCGAPGCSNGRNCYFDPGTGTIKVCESGGMCPSPLPYVTVP